MRTHEAITRSLCALALVACRGSPAGPGGPAGPPGPPGPGGPGPTGNLHLEVVVASASGLSSPLYLAAPLGDTARLFIVEQPGRISIVQHGQLLATPFLDIRDRVAYDGAEEGLLSVAFHPAYATNRFFYVDYTDLNGARDTLYTLIERYTTTSADSNVADSASHKLILRIVQPYANHNGGLVMFGPDGKLYIGMGDGGSGGDPQNRAQNPDSLLGKLLRIDVDGGDPYVNPPNNPYVGGGGRGEIWAIGLRNPWRYAFDPPSGLLFIADVGQDSWEEVDVTPASQGGLNYGWNVMEGAHCYNASACSSAGLVLPAVEYDHSNGNCAVIGGFAYRGARFPVLAGQYFYADLCSGWIRSFGYAGGVTGQTDWKLDVTPNGPHSFGVDARGELYVLAGDGTVYRIAVP